MRNQKCDQCFTNCCKNCDKTKSECEFRCSEEDVKWCYGELELEEYINLYPHEHTYK